MSTGPPVEILDELACDLLAGQPQSARDIVEEVKDPEAIGLGTAFISERYKRKEAAVLCEAAGAATERIRLITGATDHNSRHLMVTAGFALTMQSLTAGRFTLGLDRGIALLQDAYGIDHITTAQMEDFANHETAFPR
jgi:alkanesulfonate monooxygenase SsuD/methylene tetrahydromethanopterin reductase-like flavin-dependent oxidoreductase (luciferase family)